MPNIAFQGPWEDEDKQRVSSALALLLEAYPEDSIVCYCRIGGNAMPYAADIEQRGRTQHVVAYNALTLVENIESCYIGFRRKAQ